MTTIRQRIAEQLDPRAAQMEALATDLSESQQQAQMLEDSLATFGYLLRENMVSVASPAAMLAGLQEQGFDQALLDMILDQSGWSQIASLSSGGEDEGRQRTNAVKQAIRLFRYSPLAQWSIWLWTGWGLGDKITVTLTDTKAQATWNEFAAAERNEPVLSTDTIHELSDWLLVKGNRVLVLFTSTGGDNKGQSTIRVLDQDEIVPVPNPEERLDVWFYKRTFTNGAAIGTTAKVLYYPDHRTFLGDGGLIEKRWKILQDAKIVAANAERIDVIKEETAVTILHVAHNRKEEKSPWGWPITTAAGAWVKGQKQYSEARLGVAMAIASLVRRTQVKGGSRATASYAALIATNLDRNNYTDTNPPPASGSWQVENEAATTKELSMRTGAADAKADNEMFSWMALLGMGLFPTSAGLDTSRWATAVEMDKAQAMQFERYQRFWAAQFRKIVRLVLLLAAKFDKSLTFSDKDIIPEISTDAFSLSDYPDVSKAVADQVEKMLTPYVKLGVIPADTAKRLLALLWQKSLDALGADTNRELTTEDAFGVGMEDETQPTSEPDTSDDATGDEEDDTEPGMESAFVQTLQVALQNLEAGEITLDQWVTFMVEEIGEVYGEHGNDQDKADDGQGDTAPACI